MNKSNVTYPEKEIGTQIRLDIYKIPKKNHYSIVQNQKQFTDTFREHGCYYQSFELCNTEASDGFTSIANIVSTRQDEEVWLDLESYRDRKHMDDVIAKLMNDESALSLMKQYLNLISPGSSIIRAEFSRLKA